MASGKGGVGKTSVAVALTRRLARAGRRIGLVDADLYGPDVPRMLGLRRDTPAKSVTVASWTRTSRAASLEALEVDGFKVASAGFLLAGNQGLAIGSAFGDMLLGRLVNETAWGDVEALVVDLPPGTGEVQQSLLGMAGRLTAILVVTPAEVSHLDSGRALAVLRAARVPVLGGVENMAYLTCPDCGRTTELHVRAPEERTIWAAGVPRLASLPFLPGGAIDDDALTPAVSRVLDHLDA
ncbi:MAG TPA: P-loop NTPase [Pseudonocardiaceae bacterium]|nr:P-loop NTPase [Pseudonocardiaceae bacterium]